MPNKLTKQILNYFSKESFIAGVASIGILFHLLLRYSAGVSAEYVFNLPLYLVIFFGGIPLVYDLLKKIIYLEFGSDFLAGISIIASVMLGEYLAGSFVVLMLSGGQALESYATRSASSVLHALAKRMPSFSHRRQDSSIIDISLNEVQIGDVLVVYPHEICPVDGIVIEGHSIMDESYLTGEPFEISKTPGSSVISGAVNGNNALTIQATKLPIDSRYSRIMQIMKHAEENKPNLRRLGDQLGAFYTPLALGIAIISWFFTGDPLIFLAVLVVATPCPLLIAIPICIIGSISLAAKRGIIIKEPAVLERVTKCKTIIFDKTGTLTYGAPELSEQILMEGFDRLELLRLVASLEKYSRHPLAAAVTKAATNLGLKLSIATRISEPPGTGLRGRVDNHEILVTSRKKICSALNLNPETLPQQSSGLECLIAVDNHYAATYRFHDSPRHDSQPFISHLKSNHSFDKILLVSGDRESEVSYLAKKVGISEIYASKSPEQKVEIVATETKLAKTLFVGDGINDAPALATATVGLAFGQNSDITSEAAGAVVLDSTLEKVDEFFHISYRMRSIALQSAIGGMALSIIAMIFAATGFLPPVAGAICQEVIDIFAVVNALRVAFPPKKLIDF